MKRINSIRINHSDLEKVDDSLCRVYCPECEMGIITMRRDFNNMRLLNWDTCPYCSIKIIFKDIAKLRKKEAILASLQRMRN